MKSNLEKKWWFIAVVTAVSAFLTIMLMDHAGNWPVKGPAQWLVYGLCFLGISRCVSFIGWLATVLAAPNSKALN